MNRGKSISESFLALSWPKQLNNNLQQLQDVNETTTNEKRGENNSLVLQNKALGRYTTPKWKKNQTPSMDRRKNIYTGHKSKRKIHTHSRNHE